MAYWFTLVHVLHTVIVKPSEACPQDYINELIIWILTSLVISNINYIKLIFLALNQLAVFLERLEGPILQ